ncbi:hypothetical protein GBA52_007079 [Prunus armeniaca]|nr:hypothetical protein GBA52_007079 [Prunus armeniaca]
MEALKKHQKVHGKVAKFKCGACGMLFFSGPDLATHKEKKNREREDEKLLAGRCKLRWDSGSGLVT